MRAFIRCDVSTLGIVHIYPNHISIFAFAEYVHVINVKSLYLSTTAPHLQCSCSH